MVNARPLRLPSPNATARLAMGPTQFFNRGRVASPAFHQRLLPAGPGCDSFPVVNQQTESPTAKPEDRCPLCGEGTLVPSPSGTNLLCHACNRITVLPLAHRRNPRIEAHRLNRIGGRPKKAAKKP